MPENIGLRDNVAPPEPPIVAYCAYCDGGGEIYQGQYFGYDGKSCICDECIDKLWRELSTAEKLNHFGYSCITRV
jgi:hypothetical protein